MLFTTHSYAQIATGYEVGTWYGFKKVAITYSFDDNTSNQIPVAIPLLNNYNFKATFNPVINWVGGNWSGWQTAANNGHEIASHTVSHATLSNISVSEQDTECKNSQSSIRTNTGSECVTIAYPNCNIGDRTTLAKYYIAGRTCDGQTASNNPSDFFTIGSIICGSEGAMKTAQDFNTRISNAVSAKGWCVFLIHGIDNDGGYSSLSSTEFNSHLGYVHTNASTYWVAPFATVVKYIKQRNALSITETSITADSLRVVASHNLTSTLTTFNTAMTIRRVLPTGWTHATVYKNTTKIASSIVSEEGKTYVMFDVIPNDGTLFIANSESGSSSGNGNGETPTSTFTELINNGEMDNGTTGWSVQNNNNAASTLSAVTNANLSGTNAIQICPSSSNYGSSDWHIQLYQNVTLETNKEYTFSFMAKAASARTITVMFQQLAADYAVYKSFTYNLTTTAQTFTETFTLNGDVDPASKITFCVGGAAPCASIDKVSFGFTTSGSQPDTPDTPDLPSTGLGAYYTDVYRNLFTEYIQKTEAEVQAKITSVWNHFFVNSSNKVYYESSNNTAYILDVGNNDVRSEGMSYGMMICVQLDKQTEFDKLWRWAKTHMQYTSGDWDGYFAWQCNTDGSKKNGNSTTCAPDGEAYFITALFFASHRWGNSGSINYEQEAQKILSDIMKRPSGGTNSVYNMFHHTSKLITFVPYGDSYLHTDPSYCLPGFFELWARWSTSNTSFWAQTPETARVLLKNSSHPTTGLFPDYSSFDGSPFNPSWKTDYDAKRYQYDAMRCALNVGMDYHWFRSDTTNQEQMMLNLLTFFKSKNYANGQYDWNGGNPTGTYNEGIAGANGVGVFALRNNNALASEYLTRLWNTNPPTGQWRYYNGMVYFLSMLNCAGMFKIYKPACTPPASPIVTSPIEYCQNATATALTANGQNLKWYTAATGGSGSSTAPIPNTNVVGTTSYYVTQSIDGCESDRKKIDLIIYAKPAKPTVTTPVLYSKNEIAHQLTATGSNLLWYTNPLATGTSTAPTPNTASIGTTSYFVSQTISGCESDFAEIEVIVSEQEVTQTIHLTQGWNLISVSVVCANTACDISTLFKNIDVDIIKNADGFWKSTLSEELNSLQTLEPYKGYLVYMNTAATLEITGVLPTETWQATSLQNGWNMVGYPNGGESLPPISISTYFNATNCQTVKNFEGFWAPNSSINSIDTFEAGKGYFILAQ